MRWRRLVPRADRPWKPAREFPTLATGIMLCRRSPHLAQQLANIFGEERSLEILWATLPWRLRRPA